MEEWKIIDDTQGRYEVSTLGRIRSVKREVLYADGRRYNYPSKILSPRSDFYGYKIFNIRNHGKQQVFKVHRLVALAFLPNPENKKEVNHLNGNKTDNRVTNLEWVTSSQNKLHAIQMGLSHPERNLTWYTKKVKFNKQP